MCLLTRPTSTISTTSIVAGVVTLRPLRNSGSMLSRVSQSLISGPPPCTTTGCTPTEASNTRSRYTASRNSAEAMAAPPYFTTTRRPAKRWM